MLSGLLRRLRGERGQSLPELLVMMLVGGVVMAGILEVTVTAIQASARTKDRVESQQQARLAVDRVVTALSSQVCFDALTAPIVPGSTANQVTFYSDLAPAAANAPAVRIIQITYDPAAKTLTERRWSGASMTGAAARTRVTQGVVAPAAGPFSYYEYTAAAAPLPTQLITPSASGLTAEDVSDIVRVRFDVIAQTRRTNGIDGRSTTTGGDAYVQTLDPLQPQEGPRCSA